MQSGAGQLIHFFTAFAAAMFLAGQPARSDPRLSLLSTLTWDAPAPWFGGFSGMEISPDGSELWLITDRSMMVQARLHRDDGKITGVAIGSFQRLKNSHGTLMPESDEDTEALAIAANGTGYVSFETNDRVERLNVSSGRLAALPVHPDFDVFPTNTGLEALALHPDGRLFALPESAAGPDGIIPLYAFENGDWSITHHLRSSGPFRPVGADIDGNGVLYLLERALSPLGFRSRIRRFDLNREPAQAQTLLTTFPARFDNLEAISVWTDPDGNTRLIMISDDNFLPIQTTQIVEYVLHEGLASQPASQ